MRGGGHSSNRLLEPFSPCEEKTRHYEQKRSNPKNDSDFPRRAAKLFAMTKKAAFTLAETLIVISLLGVIAALTVSSLVNNYQKTINIVKLKKFYAVTTNSIMEVMAESQCITLDCVGMKNNTFYEEGSNRLNINKVKPYFPNIVVNKITNGKHSCFPNTVKTLQGTTSGISQKFSSHANVQFCLPNKIGLSVWDSSFSPKYAHCEQKNGTCALLFVYLDGNKKDAVMGRNLFGLEVKGDGRVVPISWPCSKTSTAGNNGLGCLDYLMKNGWKMDY